MGIEAKRRGWEFGEIKIDVYKSMTNEGPIIIKSLCLEISMLSDLNSHKIKILKNIADECPVKLNLEESIKLICIGIKKIIFKNQIFLILMAI